MAPSLQKVAKEKSQVDKYAKQKSSFLHRKLVTELAKNPTKQAPTKSRFKLS